MLLEKQIARNINDTHSAATETILENVAIVYYRYIRWLLPDCERLCRSQLGGIRQAVRIWQLAHAGKALS